MLRRRVISGGSSWPGWRVRPGFMAPTPGSRRHRRRGADCAALRSGSTWTIPLLPTPWRDACSGVAPRSTASAPGFAPKASGQRTRPRPWPSLQQDAADPDLAAGLAFARRRAPRPVPPRGRARSQAPEGSRRFHPPGLRPVNLARRVVDARDLEDLEAEAERSPTDAAALPARRTNVAFSSCGPNPAARGSRPPAPPRSPPAGGRDPSAGCRPAPGRWRRDWSERSPGSADRAGRSTAPALRGSRHLPGSAKGLPNFLKNSSRTPGSRPSCRVEM